LAGWLEFNVPFQHKCGYIRHDTEATVINQQSIVALLHNAVSHSLMQ